MDWTLDNRGVLYSLTTGAIADAVQLSHSESESGVRPLPDMFFASSKLDIKLLGIIIKFNPIQAISCCRVSSAESADSWIPLNSPSLIDHHIRDDTLRKLRVRQAEQWSATRTNHNVRELTYDHDWTYTSTYWGSITGTCTESSVVGDACSEHFLPLGLISDTSIPLSAFKELDFWEDELEDSGCSRMGLKLRVTDRYFYVLMKFELRLDGVLPSRSLETRIFHAIGSNELLREFKWVEAGQELRRFRVQQTIRIKP